jgi:hypothetical protein
MYSLSVSVLVIGFVSEQHGSLSDCMDAQAGLNPCWSQTDYVGIVMTRLILFFQFYAPVQIFSLNKLLVWEWLSIDICPLTFKYLSWLYNCKIIMNNIFFVLTYIVGLWHPCPYIYSTPFMSFRYISKFTYLSLL